MTAAVEITQLVKTYGRHRALDGLDLDDARHSCGWSRNHDCDVDRYQRRD